MYRLLKAFAALAACMSFMQAPVLAQDLAEPESDLWQAYALGMGVADEAVLQVMPELKLGEPYVAIGIGMGQSIAEAQAMAVDLCGVATCAAIGQPSQTCQFVMVGLSLQNLPVLAQGNTYWDLTQSAYAQGMVAMIQPVSACPMVGA